VGAGGRGALGGPQAATAAIERPPDAVGLIDHERIGTAWEDARGTTSIVEMVFAELKSAI
jgi:hypothetical protein